MFIMQDGKKIGGAKSIIDDTITFLFDQNRS